MSKSDYFALFALPPSFDIDEALLEKRYFALQRECHPDRLAGKPPAERAAATQASLRINDAWQTLRSPLKRAQYLLQREGIRVNSGEDTVKPEASILMEVMQIQEELENADAQALARLRAQTQLREESCMVELRAAFAGADHGRAAQATLRLSYLSKLAEALRLRAFSQ